MRKIIKFLSLLLLFVLFSVKNNVEAATDYPVQQMEISSVYGQELRASGNTDNSSIVIANKSGDDLERWKFTFVRDGDVKIVNISNGRLLSPDSWNVTNGARCVSYGDCNKQEQIWQVTGVDRDYLGNYINYKITNSKNPNLALTFYSNNIVSINNYTGANNQKWRLNSSGLEGFAGLCKDMNGREKAGTIGGVLGQTVTVTNVNDFMNYARGDVPRTIVIDGNLSVNGLTKVPVGKNKTIIGAYGSSIRNLYFYLDNTCKSGNFIMKNLIIKHDDTINANNDIPMYISDGNNFWLDHCTFEGHNMNNNKYLHDRDVDKFLYVGVKADYVTVSESKFSDHKYGLILGYPADDNNSKAIYTGYPRMTLSDNYFSNMTCRAPGLMRYGYFHSLNNYIENVHLGYTACTNANIYSEKNYFNRVAGIVDDYGTAKFTDEGSYPRVKASKSAATSWRPRNNYSYISMDTNKLRDYCVRYAGAQTSRYNFNYSNFNKAGVPMANYVVSGSSSKEQLVNGAYYYIKNINSNLYLTVSGSKDSNKTNIEQRKGTGEPGQVFKAVYLGNGYYKFVSQVGNRDKVIDIAGASKDNGRNVLLYRDSGGINQQFKLINTNQSNVFEIATRVSEDNSRIEVANASNADGANIQQWQANSNNCQKWRFEIIK